MGEALELLASGLEFVALGTFSAAEPTHAANSVASCPTNARRFARASRAKSFRFQVLGFIKDREGFAKLSFWQLKPRWR